MVVKQIKTRKFLPPQDNLEDLLKFIPPLENRSVVAISSKVISIIEGNTLPINSISHDKLVAKLATYSLEPVKRGKNDMILTQVGNLLVESAGVDVSNGNGYYVLLPKNPYKSAKKIWHMLRRRDKIKNLGVIITDSHSVPLRKGAIGFALASYGFRAAKVYENESDIFGKKFNFTASNVAGSLAAAAVFSMGEGNEKTPAAIITDLSNIIWFRKIVPIATAKRYAWVHPNFDVYSPLLKSTQWSKSKSAVEESRQSL